jgi:sporulation related protein
MSEDYETKRPESHGLAQEAAGERPAVEDPLVELARIVHNNKQSGANVNSGRVGNTDYFAGLDDVAVDQEASSEQSPNRVEPTFESTQPTADNQNLGHTQAPASPVELENTRATQPSAVGRPAEFLAAGHSDTSPLRPEITELQATVKSAVQAVNRLAEHPVEPLVQSHGDPHLNATQPVHQDAGVQTHLAPSVALDLEQNLTAELEDELIGALRQSVDDTVEALDHSNETPAVSPNVQPTPEFTNASTTKFGAEGGLAERSASPFADVPDPVEDKSGLTDFAGRRIEPKPAYQPEPHQDDFASSITRRAPNRPAIDENDLLAALDPTQAANADANSQESFDDNSEAAGIEALFADLDFPDPVERNPDLVERNSVTPQPHAGAPEEQAGAAEIDDMTWPAAASAVPRTNEEETPPPPEGYDLDAVARAMQESDPSLSGAGVLPPHSASEQKVVPQSKGNSRRGLFVVAGILGVAAVGAAGFYLVDGDAVQVPSGPPPVISGLQEPLKVFPDGKQTPANDQLGKLNYDRVDGSGEVGPDRLISPESPKPAELPPAPAGTGSNADLVPGAPKRVSTYIVRPDGTIVSEVEPVKPSAGTPAVQVPATSEPTSNGADAPRVVSTTPVTGGEGVTQPTTPTAVPVAPALVQTPETAPVQTAPNPATPEPANATAGVETPPKPLATILAETVDANADGVAVTVTEPVVPVPSVLPRKKPDAPVRVASAPVTPTAPAPATQSNGPLNLAQPTSAPAPSTQSSAATTSGNIPAGTYIVQVTSQRSAAAASGAYEGLQRRFPTILGNRDAVIVSANLDDRGVFYRARIPTGSRDEAISLCESLKGAGGDCFVRRSP